MKVHHRPADPLLNPAEAAALLGISPTTLQTWRAKQRYPLAYVKVGHLVRYRLSALNAFLADREVAR
jgi:predicted DNA-binding transcriptional regulator AlpA